MHSTTGQPDKSDLVVFDGVCNLCASTVQFILRHEKGPVLRFAPLQSPIGAQIMRELDIDPDIICKTAETYSIVGLDWPSRGIEELVTGRARFLHYAVFTASRACRLRRSLRDP